MTVRNRLHPLTIPRLYASIVTMAIERMRVLQSKRHGIALCTSILMACMHACINLRAVEVACRLGRILEPYRHANHACSPSSRGSTNVSGIPIGVAPGVGNPIDRGDGLGFLARRS